MATLIQRPMTRILAVLGLAALLMGALAGCASSTAGVQTSGTATATVGGSKPATPTATASAMSLADRASKVVKEMTPGAVLVGIQTPAPALVLPPTGDPAMKATVPHIGHSPVRGRPKA